MKKILCILRNHRDDYPLRLIKELGSDAEVDIVAISDAVFMNDGDIQPFRLKDDLDARGIKDTSDKDITVADLVDMVFESDQVITF